MAKSDVNIGLLRTGYPTTPMPTSQINANDLPKYVILCEVDFKISTTAPYRLVFFYSKIATFNLDTTIETKIERIAGGWRPTKFDPPQGTKRKSSMSLNNKKNAYVVFILNQEKAWQFSRNTPCFSLYDDPSTPLTLYYANPMAVGKQGSLLGANPGVTKSMLAYFIAKGDKSHAAQGNRNADRFNIHIDLNEDDSSDDPKFIPIIVDPDVGHPGGSQP